MSLNKLVIIMKNIMIKENEVYSVYVKNLIQKDNRVKKFGSILFFDLI